MDEATITRFTWSQALLSGLVILTLLLGGCNGPRSNAPLKILPLARIIRSTGCGKKPPFKSGTSENEELHEAHLERLFRLHIPTGYRPQHTYPLVLNFHGHGSNATAQEHLTGFSRLADQAGFIVAYPQGVAGTDGHAGWNTGPGDYPQSNDLRFTTDVVQQIQSQLCVNTQRVFASGFSNGGGLTNILACKMAKTFAAVAIVSGGIHPVSGGCHPTRAVAFLEIHGTADQTVPYDGNLLNDDEVPVQQTLAGWVRLDGCTSRPAIAFLETNVLIERWSNCQGGTSVVHYRLTDGGHSWPGPGNAPGIDGHSIDATSIIWHFLQAYTLSETSHV